MSVLHLADEVNRTLSPADLVRRLRQLADEIEAGSDEMSEATKAVVVLAAEDDGVVVQCGIRNMGSDMVECAGILEAGKLLCLGDFL